MSLSVSCDIARLFFQGEASCHTGKHRPRVCNNAGEALEWSRPAAARMVNPRLTELCGGLIRYEADWKWTNEPSTSSTVCISTREPFIAQSRIWSIRT